MKHMDLLTGDGQVGERDAVHALRETRHPVGEAHVTTSPVRRSHAAAAAATTVLSTRFSGTSLTRCLPVCLVGWLDGGMDGYSVRSSSTSSSSALSGRTRALHTQVKRQSTSRAHTHTTPGGARLRVAQLR